MERITYRITLDTHKSGIQRTLQGFETADNMSRRVSINLVASGDTFEVPLDHVVALMYVHRPDATEPDINECEIKDNTIIYDILPSDIAEGIVLMQLKLIAGSLEGARRVLVSPRFALEVSESTTGDEGAEVTAKFTSLENALIKAKEVYDSRLLRVEITPDCHFVVYYADGTIYENDYFHEALYNGNAILAESYAKGGTGTRDGEDTDNSWYYSNVSRSASADVNRVAEESKELLDEAKLKTTFTAFNVNFETGDLGYASVNYTFHIDEETGNLVAEGDDSYEPEQVIGSVVTEYLEESTADQNQKIDVLEARMNTFTSLEEGSTTGDAELADGRTDYTGKTWTNIGEHIRGVSGQLSSEMVKLNHSIIVVDADTDFATVNNQADANDKNCILILRRNVSVSNGDTFSYKITKVIGLGGKFISSVNDTILNFYKGTIFECGYFQMFDKTIIPRSTDFLNGECIPQWWGVFGYPTEDVNDVMERIMSSSFKKIRFPAGTYVCHPTNKMSGRTLIFDYGAIIDGIVHVAYGSNLGAENKFFCQNTKVIGKIVSTMRVGGAMIDKLSIPDGIEILDKNTNFVNQTLGGEPCGVHFHFGCKNIDIGTIRVYKTYARSNGAIAYALAIDTEENEPAPSNIYIKEIACGENQSPYYDVMLNGVNNIYIDSVACDGGIHDTSLYINSCQNINIKNFNGAKSGNSTNCIMVQNSNRVTFETARIVSPENTGTWGFVCSNSAYVMISNLITHRLGQALRLLNSLYVFITCHTSADDTTPLAEVNSDFKALHRFVSNS